MWGKSTAAALLGLPLSVALIGLVALLWPGQSNQLVLPWLLMVFPIWIGIMAGTFLFRSGKQAWLILGIATLSCFALLSLVKQFVSASL
jgi:hypothetical protein